MQRRWDTVRRILLHIEALASEAGEVGSDDIPGVDRATAAYHLRLLIEAGLVDGGCREAAGAPWCFATRLTWRGHELLDGIRRDATWQRVQALAREKGLELSFEVIVRAVRALIEGAL